MVKSLLITLGLVILSPCIVFGQTTIEVFTPQNMNRLTDVKERTAYTEDKELDLLNVTEVLVRICKVNPLTLPGNQTAIANGYHISGLQIMPSKKDAAGNRKFFVGIDFKKGQGGFSPDFLCEVKTK